MVFLKRRWVRNRCHKEMSRAGVNLPRTNRVSKKRCQGRETTIVRCRGVISHKKRIRVSLFNWQITKDTLSITLKPISQSLPTSRPTTTPLCRQHLILDISLTILPGPPPALLISATPRFRPAIRSRKACFYICGPEKLHKQGQMMRKTSTTSSHSRSSIPALLFQGKTSLAWPKSYLLELGRWMKRNVFSRSSIIGTCLGSKQQDW